MEKKIKVMIEIEKQIKVTQYFCSRCGHKWIPRIVRRPVTCPKCKSPSWDKPRRKIKIKKK